MSIGVPSQIVRGILLVFIRISIFVDSVLIIVPPLVSMAKTVIIEQIFDQDCGPKLISGVNVKPHVKM